MKVPKGKLLKVTVDHEGGLIRRARISGDFFVHPEEQLEDAEAALAGCKIQDAKAVLMQKLTGAKLYGVDIDSMQKALSEAIK
jgi:lipoate-protein ligase A